MDKRDLQRLLNQPYKQENWKQIVQFVFPNVSILSTPKEFPINNEKIKKFRQIGSVRLNDGKNLALFELLLADTVNIQRNRVELNNEISKYIDQEQIHGVLSVFEQGTDDYRFTFSARSTEFDEEESDFVQKKTDTKRYTYVLGKNESCKTPADRFYKLSENKAEVDINAIQHAFSVEQLSKEFFDKYKKQFDKFWKFIVSKEEYKNVFHANDQEKQEVKIRNFTKKLLGRIVFLHFLQKKGWMGCPEQELWGSGDKKFMQNLFKDFTNKEQFHSKCLVELFYNTLNAKRDAQLFSCEGLGGALNNTKVPYLNGGLFDSDKLESTKIDFPESYFEDLFDFFGQYNFTIDENDPNDHEVGIDPEMLGHIFENLLEDNKDKGAFYTPKVIVQYMCQESIIEYLATKLGAETSGEVKKAIEDLIRNRLAENISDLDLVEPIAQALYDVKVCDPAIGSGAFPMGILNVIYQVIEELYWIQPDSVARVWNISDTEWQPHLVKKNIIQHSIYGVDIESGAVDIARLRFWLALVVDEVEPLPLPNLDYKIMQGNSLLESVEGIDLSQISDASAYEAVYESEQIDMFSGEAKKKVSMSLNFEDVKSLMDEYFNANDPDTKKDLHKRIDEQVINHIHFTLSEHKKALKKKTNKLEKKIKLDEAAAHTWEQKEKIRTNSKGAKDLSKLNKELSEYDEKESKLAHLSNSNERPFFLWQLFYQEIFDDGGFDIVIGNPPYGVSIKGSYRVEVLKELGKVPDYEIYYYFIELSKKLLNGNGILSYIIPNTYLFNTFAQKYREKLLEEWNLIEILDCTKFSVFNTATVRNTINTWSIGKNDSIGYRNTKEIESFIPLIRRKRDYINQNDLKVFKQNWALAFFLETETIKLVTKIRLSGIDLNNLFNDLSQGLIAYDKYTGQDETIIKSRAYHYDSNIKKDLKKWILGRDVKKYNVNWNSHKYIDYCDGIANPRKPKYFNQNRVLVREITNPSIYASYTEEELYNDPSVLIILDNSSSDIKYLLGILNSKLATFYHFNYSPKATKGAFPKILVKDLKEFPIPIKFNNNDGILEVIDKIIDNTSKSLSTDYLEKIIDKWVYKIYALTYNEVCLIDIDFELDEIEYEKLDVSLIKLED